MVLEEALAKELSIVERWGAVATGLRAGLWCDCDSARDSRTEDVPPHSGAEGGALQNPFAGWLVEGPVWWGDADPGRADHVRLFRPVGEGACIEGLPPASALDSLRGLTGLTGFSLVSICSPVFVC